MALISVWGCDMIYAYIRQDLAKFAIGEELDGLSYAV